MNENYYETEFFKFLLALETFFPFLCQELIISFLATQFKSRKSTHV